MADRRCFSKAVVDNDAFLDMPLTTQLLYFHLGMNTDDEGFVSSPRKIQRSVGCSNDDMKLLIAKEYVIPFETGVVVITHWHLHNAFRKDRMKETVFKTEKSQLMLDDNKTYRRLSDSLPTNCRPTDNQLTASCQPTDDKLTAECQANLTKLNLTKPNSTKDIKPKLSYKLYGEYKHIRLTDEQYATLIAEYGEDKIKEMIQRCDEYCQQNGKTYKDYSLTIRNWIRREKDAAAQRDTSFTGSSAYGETF